MNRNGKASSLPVFPLAFAAALACCACGAESGEDEVADGGSMDTDAGIVSDAGGADGGESSSDGGLPDGGASLDYGFSAPILSPDRLSDPDVGSASASVLSENADGLRTFSLSSTAAIRKPLDGGAGVSSPRRVEERAGFPQVRTGSTLFDALYALALDEVRENSVSTISDGSFNGGAGVPCEEGGCFETGRDWHYVWTRDTAFAVDLALASVDPSRSRRSLEFKLSARRGGGGVEIVQDTGTGGSWPVSTDRVAWALGAGELLEWLSGEEREAFRDKALEALANTLERDRSVAFDESDGLYFGETSFLDWREQTYAPWTADDPSQIAMTKSLSTNLLHLKAMELASALAAEKGDSETSGRYRQWADGLKEAIRTRFVGEAGRLPSFISTPFDPAPVERSDALASALAVLMSVAGKERSAEVVASYPHAGKGVPVVWPQQQRVPIYHNRAHWPFVTGYWSRAAALVGNDRAVDFGVLSLVRGAALNLSNMENFELVSGKAWFDDADAAMSGPKVNSQRQLWSVAGYLAMVQRVVFGVNASQGRLSVAPFVTRTLRHGLFSQTDELLLKGVAWKGGTLDIKVELPAAERSGTVSGGAYAIQKATLNGKELPLDGEGRATLERSMLQGGSNLLSVTLSSAHGQAAAWTYLSPVRIAAPDGWRLLYGPLTPSIPDMGVTASEGGHPVVALSSGEEDASSVVNDIYRDGVLAVSGVPGSVTSWTDAAGGAPGAVTHCYSVRSRFVQGGNASQPSRPVCHWGTWGEGSWRIQEFGPQEFTAVSGGSISSEHGRPHLGNSWGADGDYLEVTVTARFDGLHYVQAVYGNGTSALNTGVTCAVKQVTVTEAGPQGSGSAIVGQGYLAMPTLGTDWSLWKESTLVPVSLQKGKTYRIRVGSDVDVPRTAVNMSAFEHFATYTGNGGNGGTGGELNAANIAAIKVLAMGK